MIFKEPIMVTRFDWTAERDVELTRMWSTKMSAAEISDEMGAPSRNAIIGRAHRLNLPSKRKPSRMPFYRGGRKKSVVLSVKTQKSITRRVVANPDLRPVGSAAKPVDVVSPTLPAGYKITSRLAPPIVSARVIEATVTVVPDDDSELAYPEFDPLTQTWFLTGTRKEARTLRDLQTKIGPRVRFAGYVPFTGGSLLVAIPPAIGVHSVRHAKAVHEGRLKKVREETTRLGGNSK